MSAVLLFTSAFLVSWMFWLSSGRNKIVLYVLLLWVGLQSALGMKGFYLDITSFPPKQALMLAPSLLLLIGLIVVPKGRAFLSGLDLKLLTQLHIVRVPVEIMLWMLFMDQLLPIDLTFEGTNFDIIMGITAPLVSYYYFVKKKMSPKLLMLWNLASLILLLNVVVRAVLSIESPIQAFGFDQPNEAMLHFPFNLLPALIVPIVLYSNVAALLQLSSNSARNTSH
ncbi:MAG: hypothetical protein ACI80P_001967 [Flavobacteriales bacterium]|jgi:hypothetical protein